MSWGRVTARCLLFATRGLSLLQAPGPEPGEPSGALTHPPATEQRGPHVARQEQECPDHRDPLGVC